EFRTAMAVTLWPLEIAEARYFSHAPDLGLTRIAPARAAKGGLRARLRLGGGLSWDQLALDRLVIFIAADDDVAWRLHNLVLGNGIGTLVAPAGAAAAGGINPDARQWRGAE